MSAVGTGCLGLGAMEARTLVPRAVAFVALIGFFAPPLLFVQPASSQIPCSYDLAAIVQAPDGPLHESPTYPSAISSNGQHVVGWFVYDSVGESRPWYWSQATGFIALPMPPGFYRAMPSDINNNRVICGTGSQNGIGFRGYVYDMNTGQFTILPPLPEGSWSGANAINDAGVVCGFRSIGPGTIPQTAFRWTAGTFENLGMIDGRSTNGRRINQAGDVSISTGQVIVGAFARIWLSNSVINVGPIPGGISSDASAINDAQFVLTGGIVQQTPLVMATYLFHPTHGFTPISPLPGAISAGFGAITEAGLIVGHSNFQGPGPSLVRRACLWPDFVVMNLEDVLRGDEDLALERAMDISENAVIVVEAENNKAETVTVVLTPSLPISGDTNCDKLVNVVDLLAVITSWGPCLGCRTDVNSDGAVNVIDLLHVINHWGA